MMRNIFKITIVALAFLTLAACGEKDNAPIPKPLATNIAADLKVDPVWKNSVGNGAFVANLRYQLAQNKQNIYVSAYNGSVTLLNSQTGNVIWKKSYKTTFSSGASIGEDARAQRDVVVMLMLNLSLRDASAWRDSCLRASWGFWAATTRGRAVLAMHDAGSKQEMRVQAEKKMAELGSAGMRHICNL